MDFFKKRVISSTRTLDVNKPLENSSFKFPSNGISTSKYNFIDFLPKALFIQFMRVANFFFLATAVIQSIPSISPLAPFSAIAPLALVLFISLIREFLDDWVNSLIYFRKDIRMTTLPII